MNYTTWSSGEVDERYILLQKNGPIFAVCRLIGGHRSNAEDLILAELGSRWNNFDVNQKNARSILDSLHTIAKPLKKLESNLSASAITILCNADTVRLSFFGSFLSLYRNGRKVFGGREKTIEWKSPLYDDINLFGKIGSCADRVSNIEIAREDDEFIVGTPFLDCYASESDLSQLRADKRDIQEKLFSFCDGLAEKADAASAKRSEFSPPRFKHDRLVFAIRTN